MPATLSKDQLDAQIKAFRPALLRYVAASCDINDAEDVVQSASEIAWTIIDRYDADTGPSGFCSWFRAILDRQTLEYHRKQIERAEVLCPPSEMAPLVEAVAVSPIDPFHDLNHRLERAGLTRRQKECLGAWMRGYTQREIAEALHLSQSTVNEHIARGRKTYRASHESEIAWEMLKFFRECAFAVRYKRPQRRGSFLASQKLRRLK